MSFQRRRVGEIRPSQAIHTYGVGSLVDLPNFSAVVMGLSDWQDPTPQTEVVEERLLGIVRRQLGPQVQRLAGPPVPEDTDRPDPFDPEYTRGIPITPFPRWMRCPLCNRIAPLEMGIFKLKESPYRPEQTRYVHQNCDRAGNKPPQVVPVRHIRMCKNGHIGEFPWATYVHKGETECPEILRFYEFGVSAEAADLLVQCDTCGASRRMTEAFREDGAALGPCTGSHPHNHIPETECEEPAKPTLVGASNVWFGVSISALSVPTASGELNQLVISHWPLLEPITSREVLDYAIKAGNLKPFAGWSADEIWDAIEAKRNAPDEPGPESMEELKQGEWMIFSDPDSEQPTPDLALRKSPIPPGYEQWIESVVLADRLRVVNALVGFTRVISPGDFADLDEIDEIKRGPLDRKRPDWVPASEVRGEGIFLRVREEALTEWEAKVSAQESVARTAHTVFREARKIENPSHHFPGMRYILLHSLAHALIRQFAIECGYAAASLQERIYAGSAEDGSRMAGILLYTAAADSEGTLGGLVHLGEPEILARHLYQALEAMRLCASDPLCAEHDPGGDPPTLHGAACHACLFAAETSCERGNKYLDRRLLVETLSRGVIPFFTSG